MLSPITKQGRYHKLMLTGLGDQEEDLLIAAKVKTVIKKDSSEREILTEVGSLGLVSYERISREVILVPVNGAQCPQNAQYIKDELNRIYAPAIVSWSVKLAAPLRVDNLKSNGFGSSEMNAFSRYTPNMRKLTRAFKKTGQKEKHTLVLFFIKDPSVDFTGFMPLSSDFGFIFNFGSESEVIAHELAHGAFNLRHTFSTKAKYPLAEKTTRNLMDYNKSSELWKYQWDRIHNPESIFFSAYDEDEGASVILENSNKLRNSIERLRYSYAFNKEIDFVNTSCGANNIVLGNGLLYKEISLGVNESVPFVCNPYLIKPIVFKGGGFDQPDTRRIGFGGENGKFSLSVKVKENELESVKEYLILSKEEWFESIDYMIREKLLINISCIPLEAFYDLTGTQRVDILRLIHRKSMREYLMLLNKLLITVPNVSQSQILIDFLQKDNTGFFVTLNKALSDNERIDFFTILSKIYIKSLGEDNFNKIVLDFENKTSSEINKTLDQWARERVFFWLSPTFLESIKNVNHKFLYNNMKFIENGSLSFTIEEIRAVWSWNKFDVILRPFDLIRVDLKSSSDILNQQTDEIIYIPALLLFLLEQERWNQEMIEAINLGMVLGGASAIATAGKTAVIINAVKPIINSEIGMFFSWLRLTPKSFITLFMLDASVQVSTNYIFHSDLKDAIDDLDLFDAMFSGVVGNVISIPIKGSQLLYLSLYGKQFSVCKQIAKNTTQVVSIELTKVLFDYKIGDTEFKIMCDSNEDYYDVMCKLILSLSVHYSTDEIHIMLKNWNIKMINTIEVNSIVKPLLYKINEIVKTDNFRNIIILGPGVISKQIDQLRNKTLHINLKVLKLKNEFKEEEILKQEIKAEFKKDNTKVVLLFKDVVKDEEK